MFRIAYAIRSKSALVPRLLELFTKRIPAIDINFRELITLVSCRNRFFVLKLILLQFIRNPSLLLSAVKSAYLN